MIVKMTDDTQLAEEILHNLRLNDNYCISKPKAQDTKCICQEFLTAPKGTCRCGLYVKTQE